MLELRMIAVFPSTGSSLEGTLLSEPLNFITDHFDEEGATTPLADHFVDSGHQVHR